MIETRENIISSSYQNALIDLTFGESFEWFFNERTFYTKYKQKFDGDTFQFTNIIIDKDRNVNSRYSDFITPLILSTQDAFNIKIKELIRVKFNMTLNISNSCIIHPPHVDSFEENCVSVVYYVHDCDGKTVLYDNVLNYIHRQKYNYMHRHQQ